MSEQIPKSYEQDVEKARVMADAEAPHRDEARQLNIVANNMDDAFQEESRVEDGEILESHVDLVFDRVAKAKEMAKLAGEAAGIEYDNRQ